MYLFRVMNSYDQIMDPVNNGIASKRIIYDATEKYLYSTKKDIMDKLSLKDKKFYIKEYMNTYLFEHKHRLNKIFLKKHMSVRNNLHRYVRDKDIFAYFQMLKDLSSLPNHLINGSRTMTNWISFTNNFDKIWNYYDRQVVHKVCVIDVCTNGVFDENTYVVNVSDKEIVQNIKFLSNKIKEDNYELFVRYLKNNPELEKMSLNFFHKFVMSPTNKKFMGFNFSIASNEYDIYEYLDKDCVVSVLEQLQIDLICADIFNERFLLLSHREQIKELGRLKQIMLKHVLKENNPYLLYVFEELYLKGHNILNINSTEEEKERFILTRNEIISKSIDLPSILIKRKYK